jgi:hypothetical protein
VLSSSFDGKQVGFELLAGHAMESRTAPQGASEPAASTEPSTELMSLPPKLRNIIVRALTRDAARQLAATATANLQGVLEARADVRAFTVDGTLARSIARLHLNTPAQRIAAAAVGHQGYDVAVSFPLHTAPLICAEQLAGAPIPDNPALLWFSPTLVGSATSVNGWRQSTGNATCPLFAARHAQPE